MLVKCIFLIADHESIKNETDTHSTVKFSRRLIESDILQANRAEKRFTKAGFASTPPHWTMLDR